MASVNVQLQVRRTLSLEEAAQVLKTTPETVSAMIRGEGLPAVKVGRAWVLVEEDVIQWLRDQYMRKEIGCFSEEASQPFGGAIFDTKAGELERALARPTGSKRRNTRTASKHSSGALA